MTNENEETGFQLTGKTYDRAKWFVQIFLPAVSALYLGLAQLWDLPKPEAVVGTIALVTVFLGVILNISANNYRNDPSRFMGTAQIVTTDEGPKPMINVTADSEQISDAITSGKKELVIKVAP